MAYIKGNVEDAYERLQLSDFDEEDLEKVQEKLKKALDEVE